MYEQPEVVVIPIFEDDKETDGTKSSNDLAKQTTELKEQGDTESLYRRVKEVAHFVDEDKIKIWQEGGNDLDEEDKAILDEFLPRTGDVHCMWENIINGDLDSVKNWIEKASKEEINKCDSHNGLNALHYSIIFKKTELVETLLESGAAPDYSSEDGNLLPLHLTLLGLTSFSDAIRLLINHKADVNMPSKKGPALHLAFMEDKLDAVIILLKHGADPNFCWYETTILERAIEKQNRSMVKAMLEIPSRENICQERLKERICTATNTKDGETDSHHGHTPFSKLIVELPDIAECVLNKCITTENTPNQEDYTVLFDCSLFENGSRTNKCLKSLPCVGACELSRAIMDEESDTICKEDVYDYEKRRHPLYQILLSNDARLLKHPLVHTLLEWKLKKFGWLYYYINLMAYLILVVFLTTFILVIPNPQSYKCLKLTNISDIAQQEILCEAVGLEEHTTFIIAIKILILLFAIVRLLVELYQLYIKKVISYFKNWANWVEIAHGIASVIFVAGVDKQSCFCPSKLEWEAGIVSMALTWVVLVVWLKTMHLIGIYVTMMLKIIQSFLKVAIFGVLLVVGFGLSFYLLFYQPPPEGAPDTPATYSNRLRSILAIIPLTAGDIGIDDVFYTDTEAGPPIGREYETLAFIIWICALIIMTVLYSNLLVGLAVGEVSNVIEKAQITIIKQRIDLVLTLEEQLLECIHRKMVVKEPIRVKPSKLHKSLGFCKGVIDGTCCVCSCLICNITHLRYWGYQVRQPSTKKPSKIYMDLPRLNKEILLEEAESCPLVTKEEVQSVVQAIIKKDVGAMLDKLKEELTSVMQPQMSLQ